MRLRVKWKEACLLTVVVDGYCVENAKHVRHEDQLETSSPRRSGEGRHPVGSSYTTQYITTHFSRTELARCHQWQADSLCPTAFVDTAYVAINGCCRRPIQQQLLLN